MATISESALAWARAEFGGARLGDLRRTGRLVMMAAQAATRPHGLVTRVFEDSAERQAAFKFLENSLISASAMAAASQAAAFGRTRGEPLAFVAVDATALTITDQKDTKGLGPLTTKGIGTRGAFVMNALGLRPDGTTLGIYAQSWWVRGHTHVPRGRKDRRSVSERETRHWIDVLQSVNRGLAATAPGTRPWYQLDRGGDCAAVFAHAVDERLELTVRAAHDRRLAGSRRQYLWNKMRGAPALAWARVGVPATATRPARSARVTVRAAQVALRLALGLRAKGPYRIVKVYAVYVRETYTPAGQEPLEWMLLTTHPVETAEDALQVVRGYTMRWRVEEFHRAWKSGVCQVERSQLRSFETLKKWATLLASVAVRAERLKMLSRQSPDVPATQEFTREEIDAVIILREPKGRTVGETPTLGEVVRWIADLGGYTGKSSGGPPGTTVIARALPEVLAAARVLESQRHPKRKRSDQC